MVHNSPLSYAAMRDGQDIAERLAKRNITKACQSITGTSTDTYRVRGTGILVHQAMFHPEHATIVSQWTLITETGSEKYSCSNEFEQDVFPRQIEERHLTHLEACIAIATNIERICNKN